MTTTEIEWKTALVHLYGTLAVCGLAFCGAALLTGLVLVSMGHGVIALLAFAAAGTSIPVTGVLAYAAQAVQR